MSNLWMLKTDGHSRSFLLKPGDLEYLGSNWKKPADLAVIRVFYQDRFLCRAVCQELSGQRVSLKEIEKARSERRKQVRAGVVKRQTVVDRYIAVHQVETPKSQVSPREPAASGAKPRLKRYFNE
jgi:putative transposase